MTELIEEIETDFLGQDGSIRIMKRDKLVAIEFCWPGYSILSEMTDAQATAFSNAIRRATARIRKEGRRR